MREITGYLTYYTAPSAGFSEGQLKDDPGDGTGSGITVQTHNDYLYGFVAPIIKYKGALSDTAESETASDVMDAIERIAGVQNENVSEYDNTQTYAQDAHVMYLGLQFVSMISSNTGNPPLDNPDKWLPCLNRDDAVLRWRNGEPISGGMEELHNFRDSSYRQLFQWGKYNFGGDSGRNFQATGLHLDGTQVTGDATLIALLDVGGADEYHLLDVIAPDVGGTRTLLDTRGRVPRIVDVTAGDTEDVGGEQEDQFQGHWHNIGDSSGNTTIARGTTTGGATEGAQGDGTSNEYRADNAIDIVTDGVNGTPRTGDETRMKNYTEGVRHVLIMQEI